MTDLPKRGTMPYKPKFACRLNSFLQRQVGSSSKEPMVEIIDIIDSICAIEAITHINLNYPDHLKLLDTYRLLQVLGDHGVELNGFEMRYYSDRDFAAGAFTNPSAAIRNKAVDFSCKAMDEMAELGGRILNLWLGQDGFDYSMQVDYLKCWENELECIRKVAQHNPSVNVSIEYKPSDPRAFSILQGIGTTLVALTSLGLPNVGITLDFNHCILARENPSFSLVLASIYSKVLGIHLNDGYGYFDNGFMVGSTHFIQTIEFLYYLLRVGYDGVLYFDTFPQNEDPAHECEHNAKMVTAMIDLINEMDVHALQESLDRQDSMYMQRALVEIIGRNTNQNHGGKERVSRKT